MTNCGSSRGLRRARERRRIRHCSQPLLSTRRRRQHLHQLTALLRHVAFEHPFERRIELEQAPVKEGGGIVGNRTDRGKAFLDRIFCVLVNISRSPLMTNATFWGKRANARVSTIVHPRGVPVGERLRPPTADAHPQGSTRTIDAMYDGTLSTIGGSEHVTT